MRHTNVSKNNLWSSLDVTPSCFSWHRQQGGGPVWNKGLGSRADCRRPLRGGFSSLLPWACAPDSPGIPASRQNRWDEQPRGEAPGLLPLGSSPHTLALGKASCPVAPLLSTRAPSALPSMLTWPVPDPRQSSHRIALPAGARVNVCTLGCHRNTFLCKVEKSGVSFFCVRDGAMERGPGLAWALGLEGESSDGRVHWVSLWARPKGTGGSLVSSVAQSCPTLRDPLDRSMPGLHVHHQLPEFTQTHVH